MQNKKQETGFFFFSKMSSLVVNRLEGNCIKTTGTLTWTLPTTSTSAVKRREPTGGECDFDGAKSAHSSRSILLLHVSSSLSSSVRAS